MVLNEAAVRSAKPGSMLWDDSLKGFGLRVGKTSKTFVVLVASGRRKRLGRYPLLSLADARSAARKILAEKTLGRILPKHTAFDEAKASFLENCASRLRPLTVRLYRYHLNRHFKFGRSGLGDITPKEILRALKDLKPSEKEHAFRIGRTFFTWCRYQHLIDRSPMETLESPPTGDSRERFLEDDELKKVYRHALKLENGVQRLVWLLLRTGQRPGELRALKTSYLGVDRITLPKEVTKNGRRHTFPISKQFRDVVSSFPTDSEYVLPAARSHVRGKPVELFSATSEARTQFRKECGVDGWTLHDLRRTVSTHLQRLGVRLEVIEALLNHVSGTRSGIVGVYQRHDFFPEMKEAISLWEKKLAKLAMP
jgi:integrase